jgi:hypothetical protein
MRRGISGFTDLIKKSLGMILIFISRTWLSEPNIILILPLAVILTAIGELNSLAFNAIWILPLVITIFNTSPPQLLALNFPQTMEKTLNLLEEVRTFRLVARTAFVIPWQIAGWWIVVSCFKSPPSQVDEARSEMLVCQA